MLLYIGIKSFQLEHYKEFDDLTGIKYNQLNGSSSKFEKNYHLHCLSKIIHFINIKGTSRSLWKDCYISTQNLIDLEYDRKWPLKIST